MYRWAYLLARALNTKMKFGQLCWPIGPVFYRAYVTIIYITVFYPLWGMMVTIPYVLYKHPILSTQMIPSSSVPADWCGNCSSLLSRASGCSSSPPSKMGGIPGWHSEAWTLLSANSIPLALKTWSQSSTTNLTIWNYRVKHKPTLNNIPLPHIYWVNSQQFTWMKRSQMWLIPNSR